MTDKIIEEEIKQEEVVNDLENTTDGATNVHGVKQDEVVNDIEYTTNRETKAEEVKQEEVVKDIENTTNSEINVEGAKQAKTQKKGITKVKTKNTDDTDAKLTKAEIKELKKSVTNACN